MASVTGAPPLRSRPNSYDYFDVDDILATQERVPSKIEIQIHNLGFLDTSSEGDHVQPGAKLELPFWLAKELCSRKRKIVSVDMPKVFREGYRQILKADANVVDLHKLGPYFYNFGIKLLHFDNDENPQMAKCLQDTFVKRFRRIMDSSQNAPDEDTSHLTGKLDHVERQVFHAGQKGVSEFLQWEGGSTAKLKTSETVVNHKKRKRSALE